MEASYTSVAVSVRNRLILLYYCENSDLTDGVPKALKLCNRLINSKDSFTVTLTVLAKLLQRLVKIYRIGKKIVEMEERDVSWRFHMRNVSQTIEDVVDIICINWKSTKN